MTIFAILNKKKESIMIKRKEEMETIYPEHVCNGLGSIEKKFVFSTEEMLDKAKMFARITLPDGSSIGEHPHQPEAEIYYILEGEVVVTDNDRQEILHPGDAVFTGNGDRHSVTNASGKPAVLMAVILW